MKRMSNKLIILDNPSRPYSVNNLGMGSLKARSHGLLVHLTFQTAVIAYGQAVGHLRRQGGSSDLLCATFIMNTRWSDGRSHEGHSKHHINGAAPHWRMSSCRYDTAAAKMTRSRRAIEERCRIVPPRSAVTFAGEQRP